MHERIAPNRRPISNEVIEVTNQEAKEIASRLGMSAWKQRVSVEEDRSQRRMKCVGFASANFIIACAESWEEALDRAAGLVFSA